MRISNPARAFLEYLNLLEKNHSFDEAYYLLENLTFVSPDLMQEALENCRSIKVKRLALCLAKKQNVSWYKDLNLANIDLGRGIRQIIKGVSYDAELQITYLKSWDQENDEVLF